MKSKNIFIVLAFVLTIVTILLSGVMGYKLGLGNDKLTILKSQKTPGSRLMDKYSVPELSKVTIDPGVIKIEEELKKDENFTSYLFSILFSPTLEEKKDKKVTGLINIPKGEGPFPLILMLRGYVDQEAYKTGMGTRSAGEYFANNGFIIIAPDFLGYGGSDSEAGNIYEARFQTYTTTLSVISSLSSIKIWDQNNLFLWGHSNGGHIALTTLEITEASLPTALWAPVSKPFPYAILYFTDESDDKGKLIRRELSKFEEDYDTDYYSIHNYFEQIKAPIQIHQGTVDDAVPVEWSNELYGILNNLGVDVIYYKYPGANHNMIPGWDRAIERDLEFFNANIK